METKNNLQKNIGIFIGSVVILGVLFATVVLGKQSSNSSTPVADQTSSNNSNPKTNPTNSQNQKTTPVVITQTPPIDTPKKATYLYKDGTYSATGSYMSPGGMDKLSVTLTLKNDIITSVSVTPQAGDRTSSRYQNMFISGYQQYVLGKDIANVSLTKVSGSSLTPKGFDDALKQIKSQAIA